MLGCGGVLVGVGALGVVEVVVVEGSVVLVVVGVGVLGVEGSVVVVGVGLAATGVVLGVV